MLFKPKRLTVILAIGVTKELVGGLGMSQFNPALFGRVAMIILVPFICRDNLWPS